MDIYPYTKIIQSAKLSLAIRLVVGLFLLLVGFWAGMAVGFRKAEFSSHFSDRYYSAFGMHQSGGMMGIPDVDGLVSGHGTVGKVLSVSLPHFVVSDRDGTEKIVTIDGTTVVRSVRDTIASTSVKADDFVVVIGNPDTNGGIIAKLIRIMPASGIMATSSYFYSTTTNTRGPNMMYAR